MNALRHTMSLLAPTWYARRLRAQRAIRLFEAASSGRRTASWRTSNASINSETLNALPTLRERSRDLATNNAYARRGIAGLCHHIVGSGVVPQVKPGSRRIGELFREWAGKPEMDAAGRLNFYALQHLALKTVIESGECLVRRRFRETKAGRVPLQVQVLEPDFIDTAKNLVTNNVRVVQGVEFNQRGERTAYWLFDEHPGEATSLRAATVSRRVDAAEVIHVFDVLRPGQVRGLPWLTPVMLRFRDFDLYEDAQLLKQQISAMLVACVHDMDGSYDGLGEDEQKELSKLEPGSWQILPPGKTVTFSNPPSVQGYSEYAKYQLHAIAAGLGAPYELVTSDYSAVNYSSARMAFQEFYRSVEHWRWNMLVPQLLDSIFRWFVDAAELKGLVRGGTSIGWTPPKREFIDPEKDVKAQLLQVSGCLTSLSELIRASGGDPDEVFDELASDMKRLKDKGLTFNPQEVKQ